MTMNGTRRRWLSATVFGTRPLADDGVIEIRMEAH